MGAARKLDTKTPRVSTRIPKKGKARPATGKLKLVDAKLTTIEVRWTDACMADLQRKCYHLRMARNWTQAELAERIGLCVRTINRFEDPEQPMLEPRLRTFLQIFHKGFGMKVIAAEPE